MFKGQVNKFKPQKELNSFSEKSSLDKRLLNFLEFVTIKDTFTFD